MPGWVLIRPSPTLRSPWQSVSVPLGDARRVLALLGEAGGEEEVLTGRQVFGGLDVLFDDPGEVVDVAQPVVLDVERVTAEPAAVGEQHARCTWFGQVDERADAVGAVADVGRDRLGDLRAAGPVDVTLTMLGPAAGVVSE